MTDSVEMWCPNCKVVLDVYDKGDGLWYVENPDFRLVVADDGSVGPNNAMSAHQNQYSAEGPLCVRVECVISETRGLLSNEPIPVNLGTGMDKLKDAGWPWVK